MPELKYQFLDAIEANERDLGTSGSHWRLVHGAADGILHAASLTGTPTLTLRLVAEASELHDYAVSVLRHEFDHDPICILPEGDVVVAVFDPAAPAGHPSKR